MFNVIHFLINRVNCWHLCLSFHFMMLGSS